MATRRSPVAEQAPPDVKTLPRVWESSVLREDVAKGKLDDDVFAASLPDVVSGQAKDVYQKPDVFFERTHLTASLRDLLASVHSRLFEPESTANPILRLETSFGGGKTHSLIALWHAARAKGDIPALADVVTPARGVEKVRVAAVVGTHLEPTSRPKKELAQAPRTLWGEIARQVGGAEGYALVAENDATGVAPAAPALAKLLGTAPTLVMIDEVAQYQRRAKEVTLARGTLDQQTPAFLHSLFETAGSPAAPNLVVVLTLASREDAYHEETADILERLQEMQSVLARKERILEPVGDRDLAAVLRRRLFERVDDKQALAVATAFQTAYQAMYEKGGAIPADAARPEYRTAIAASYPFHPALLNVLDKKVATLDTFQRTRGALRLLAHVLRSIFKSRPEDGWLLQPGHVDLSIEAIALGLSTRLKRKREPIGADIVSDREGDPAHAQALDRVHRQEGRPPVATRVAQAIWLHSLSTGNAGCDEAELNLAVLTPTLDPMYVENAFKALLDEGWYLFREGHRLRFKDEPSLNKVVAEAVKHVPPAEARQLVETQAREVYKDGPFKLVAFKDEPEAIEDDTKVPKLVLVHMDSVEAELDKRETPDFVAKLSKFKSSKDDFRQFPNQVVFLVANAQDKAPLLEAAKRAKALQAIKRDKERVKSLTREQRDDLEDRLKSSDLELRVAITNCYRHLFYPSGSSAAHEGLDRITLPSHDRTTEVKEQQQVLVELLKGAKKLLASGDKPLAASYVKDKLGWPEQHEEFTLDKFFEAFWRKRELPIVLDPQILKQMVVAGAKDGTWGFHDGETLWFSAKDWPHTDPVVSAVRMDAKQKLVEANRAKVLTKPKKRKPATKGEDDEGTDAGDEGGDNGGGGLFPPKPSKKKAPAVVRLPEPALPNRAFEQVLGELAEHPTAKVHWLRLTIESGGDVKKLAKALPLWVDFDAWLDAEAEASWQVEGQERAERQTVAFQGTWSRYQAHAKGAVEGICGATGADLTIKVRLVLSPQEPLPPDDPNVAKVRDELTRLNVGALDLEVGTTPEEVGA